MTILLGAAPAFAAPAVDVQAPSMLGVEFLAKHSSTSPARADSGKIYAKMWTPRTKTGAIHLHGGLFAPSSARATSSTLGARIGVNMGAPLLFGILTDWTYKSKSVLQPVDTGLPGYRPNTVLATAEAHLLPVMTFLQVTLTQRFFLAPYAGVGAGYEWLVLKAKDNRTAASGSIIYSNWAWQSYAGMGIRLTESLHVDGEAFYNGGTLARTVPDLNGVSWRETVNVNGAGARVGLHIVY